MGIRAVSSTLDSILWVLMSCYSYIVEKESTILTILSSNWISVSFTTLSPSIVAKWFLISSYSVLSTVFSTSNKF